MRADEKLKLVHVDLCGPISPETAGGNRYFMPLVDDHSRWMEVYMLKHKDQAIASTKLKLKNTSECNIKTLSLRLDRGGEFLAEKFASVCEHAPCDRCTVRTFFIQPLGDLNPDLKMKIPGEKVHG